MMKVDLIYATEHARELLIFSKKTRLRMSPKGFEEILLMDEKEKQKEIEYVFGTIGSSWEFVDYIFLIQGVTRAFTHQLVRHRVGVSFAQQAQRVVNASEEFDYLATGGTEKSITYHQTMSVIKSAYKELIQQGVHPQDARGILPTNILTNIMMKINLRSLSGLLNIRLCVKAQGEFQDVARELRRKAVEIHPWAEPVLRVHCAQHGNCAFKSYNECSIKTKNMIGNLDTGSIQEEWEHNRSESQPTGEE